MGGITLAALSLVGVGIVFPLSGGSSSSSSSVASGISVPRMRTHNLKLEQTVLLLKRHGPKTAHARLIESDEPAGPRQSTANVVSGSQAGPESSTESLESECDPNYEGVCLDPNASDYDCEGGDGNGPDYTGEVRVVGEDHFGLDADGDGLGCESE